MVFLEFRSKFTKFGGNSWNSSQALRAFITGFPVSSMGVCGYFLEQPIVEEKFQQTDFFNYFEERFSPILLS